MLKLIYFGFIILLSYPSIVIGKSVDETEYREECGVWKNVTKRLDAEQNVEMDCIVNPQCTGYNCDGTYTYSGIYSVGDTVSVNYCFGMAIHPCQKPPNMEFYVELIDTNSSYSANVSQDGQFEIPGASHSIGGLGTTTAFVVVTMEPETISGQHYMKLGLKLKIRVTTIIGLETWPASMQRTLMPPANIPVPPCENTVLTPHHVPHTCQKYTPTPAPPTTTTTQNPDAPAAKTCDPNTMHACGMNEECHLNSAKKYMCTCMQNYIRLKDVCWPIMGTEIPTYHIDPIENKTSNSSLVIIGCVVTLIVLLGGIVGAVIWRYKRYRERYGQHSMLMTSDDDDDAPLDIST